MFSKLYFIYYSFLKSKKSFDPTFNAVSVVYLTQVIYFFVISILFGKVFGYGIPKFNSSGSINKILFLPFAILWFYFCFRYFRNSLLKSDLKKVLEKNKIGNAKVLVIFILTFIIPLYLLIILSGGQVWK